jgi:hypothetical protein
MIDIPNGEQVCYDNTVDPIVYGNIGIGFGFTAIHGTIVGHTIRAPFASCGAPTPNDF